MLTETTMPEAAREATGRFGRLSAGLVNAVALRFEATPCAPGAAIDAGPYGAGGGTRGGLIDAVASTTRRVSTLRRAGDALQGACALAAVAGQGAGLGRVLEVLMG
ncbi:MAG: hypothetical protein IPH72_07950 [Sandaracinaceae bacterium]|nr:hypothetical protein [Sandaracinaceae bacterium]